MFNTSQQIKSIKSQTKSLLLYPIVGFIVYVSTRYFVLAVGKAFLRIGESASGDEVITSSNTLNVSTFELIMIGIKRLGDLGIIIGVGALGLGYSLFYREDKRFSAYLFSSTLFVFMFWSLSEFFIGDIIAGWRRGLRPAALIGTIGVGSVIYRLSKPINGLRNGVGLRFLLLWMVILSVLLLGAGNAHSGPWTESSNSWVADSEIDGWDWYFDYKSKNKPTVTLGSRIDRYAMYLMPPKEQLRRYNEFNFDSNQRETVPANYGYPQKLGNIIPNTYYISSKPIRQNRIIVHPKWDVLTKNDINRLNGDDTVDKVYDNENVEVNLAH